MVCQYWFGFGNESEQISISAFSWVYPNKPTSFRFKNAGTDCLSLKCSPICPCVLIICRAVCFYLAAQHLAGEHRRSGYLAWKPGEVILLNVHSFSVPENRNVQQGAILSGKKGAGLAGDTAACLLAEWAKWRGKHWQYILGRSFWELSVPLLLLAQTISRLARKPGVLFLNVLSFPCLVGREGEKDHLFSGWASGFGRQDIPQAPWTFWNKQECQLALSPIITTRKFGLFSEKKKKKNCLQGHVICERFKGISGVLRLYVVECVYFRMKLNTLGHGLGLNRPKSRHPGSVERALPSAGISGASHRLGAQAEASLPPAGAVWYCWAVSLGREAGLAQA